MSQTLPNETIDKVSKAISQALRDVTSKDQERRDLRDELTNASSAATTVREELLIKLATMAANDHWSKYDIDEGCEKALAGRNDKDTSIRTFSAEIKRACHPEARKHVASFAKLAANVWEDEAKQSKDMPKPCRAAFSRQYHLFQRLISAAIDENTVYSSRDDVVKWAIKLDPKNNPTRMFKRFKALRDELREMSDTFEIANVVDALEYLREVAADDFKGQSKPTQKSPAKPAEAPEPVSEGEDSPEDVDSASEAPKGVSELLDEALADIGA